MSLGFSVADFVTLHQLAWKVHTALKDAPGNHKALSDEVLSLHEILIRLTNGSPNVRKDLRSTDRADFERVVTRCRNTLSDVEAILERYSSSRKGKARIWARARFAAVDLTPLRLRIAAQVDRLHAYNNMALLRSQARTERKTGRVIEALRSQGSVISTDSESNCSDTEQSWSAFGRALEEEGITLHMAIENRALLKQSLIDGSIPEKAKKHEEPSCLSLKQVEHPLIQPSACHQFQGPEEAHMEAWKEVEPQTREESWQFVLSGDDLQCPEPSDCDEQKSCMPADEDSESITTSSGSIESWYSSHDQITSPQPVVDFLNMESFKDEETQSFWVLQG